MTSILRLLPSFSPLPTPPLTQPLQNPPFSSDPATSLATTLCLAIIHYVRLYGARALLVTVLSLITVFRREMSSNRVYLSEEEELHQREVERRRRRRRRRRKEGENEKPKMNTATTTASSPTAGWTASTPSSPASPEQDNNLNNTSSYEEEEELDCYERADDLLNHAGLYCAGFGDIITMVLSVWAHILLSRIHEGKEEEKVAVKKDGEVLQQKRKEEGSSDDNDDDDDKKEKNTLTSPQKVNINNFKTSKIPTISTHHQNEIYLTSTIPPDAQVHLFTYLHPLDIINFSCASTSCHSLIHSEDCNGISALLWKTLWRRDYAWVVMEWKVGREALCRSLSVLSSMENEKDYIEKELFLQKKKQGFIKRQSSRLSKKSSFGLFWNRSSSSVSFSENNDNDNKHEEEGFQKDDTVGVLRRLASVFDEKTVVPLSPPSSFNENDVDVNDDDEIDIHLPPLPSFIFSSDSTRRSLAPNLNKDVTVTASEQQQQNMMTMKEFYFIFSQCWINYALAGQSTYDNCLVGLHGHVFDITNFLEDHPGSSETLLVNGGGRDATKYFEDLGHSVSARKMAGGSFCVVMDGACLRRNQEEYDDDEYMNDDSFHGDGDSRRNKNTSTPSSLWGLKRPTKSILADQSLQLMPMTRSKPTRPGTLYSIRQRLEEEERLETKRAEELLSQRQPMLINFQIYYDPFLGRWRAWWMNEELEIVHIDM